MRYLFWFLFGAAFCYMLGAKQGLLSGAPGEIEAIIYGGLDGLGVAVATSKKLSWSVPLKFLIRGVWAACLFVMYIFVFSSANHRIHGDDIFWGLLFGLPAPLILIIRGILISRPRT